MPSTNDSMVDNVMPSSQWAFDAEVTAVFEDMLKRSIPQYDVMRQTVFDIGATFIRDTDHVVIDLGCSRGDSLAPFVKAFPKQRFIGIEVSESMYLTSRARFAGNERVVIRQDDLRYRFPSDTSDLTLSILTLQFIPIEYRQRIVQQVYDGLADGGALILVEKVLGNTARLDQLMVQTYYALKSANGYSTEQIERKRLSLEGVLVPVTAHWNEELLQQAGFRQVDCFWRWMNFAGWVAIK